MSFDLQRIFRRIQHVVRPARLAAPSQEAGVIQRIQPAFNSMELHETNSMQHFGFASGLPAGTDVMIVNVSGDNANGVAIASNNQSLRPKGIAAGECRIYNAAGDYVHVAAGQITIVAATKVVVTSPEVTMSGKLTVTGDITSTGGDVVAGTISLKTHVHQQVTVGTGLSGVPKP
ncbi:phage baseplate assembly protein [Roseicella sp. DB1501]|uniref:phage baseplate assembly protein domain-containing protein n=1 Tax=Roseicella sp. DB1501 TaxID=2730925 RepID=UPI0014917023|nr:phage baseplate assembly protein [Roseicella sp. DB1501]NOG69819.1 hypothetical protein [Roseicella sp. DB1501]